LVADNGFYPIGGDYDVGVDGVSIAIARLDLESWLRAPRPYFRDSGSEEEFDTLLTFAAFVE